jgi:hypothetical protein
MWWKHGVINLLENKIFMKLNWFWGFAGFLGIMGYLMNEPLYYVFFVFFLFFLAPVMSKKKPQAPAEKK